MRTSTDEIKDGVVFNGFDYALQVWVVDGVIQTCGCPQTVNCDCFARIVHGLHITNVKGHEKRGNQMDIKKLAKKYLDYFVWDKRDNGDGFVKLKDGAPHELGDLVRAAHDGMFPDDYKYEFIEEALRAIVDNDDADDIQLEADAYNNELLKWLSSNLERAGYVEEAVQEYGIDGKDFNLYNVIGLGQLREKEVVLGIVRSELEKIAEEEEGPQI